MLNTWLIHAGIEAVPRELYEERQQSKKNFESKVPKKKLTVAVASKPEVVKEVKKIKEVKKVVERFRVSTVAKTRYRNKLKSQINQIEGLILCKKTI